MNLSLLRSLVAFTTPKELLAVLLAAVLSAGCGIGLMGAAAWLIAKAALQPPLYALALGITMVRACGIGRAVFRYLDRWFSHRLAFRCYAVLQLRIYDQAEAAIPLKDGALQQGAFLHQLLDSCETLRDFYLRALLPVGTTSLITLLCISILYDRTPAGALLLGLLWLLHLLLPAVIESSKSMLTDSKQAYRKAILEIGAGGAELLQTNNRQPLFRLLDQPADKVQQVQQVESHRQDHTDWILASCCQLSFVLLFFLLALAMHANQIDGIELSVWLFIFLALFQEYPPLSSAIRIWKKTRQAASVVQCDYSNDSKKSSLPVQPHLPLVPIRPNSPLLSVQHLSFAYQPSVPILKDLSFTLHQGQHTAILGESGSGKTTLGYLLLGFWEPDQGIICIQGHDYQRLPPAVIRSQIAASLQGCCLFHTSLRNTFLRLHPDCPDAVIWHSLKLAQLADFVHQLPHQLDTPLGPDACRLSGGQRNRLLTALALTGQSPILLLDEPTAGLDQSTAQTMMADIIRELDQTGRTLLIITHDLPLAGQLAQRILLH